MAPAHRHIPDLYHPHRHHILCRNSQNFFIVAGIPCFLISQVDPGVLLQPAQIVGQGNFYTVIQTVVVVENLIRLGAGDKIIIKVPDSGEDIALSCSVFP